ncbi:MAG: cyclase family protein [Gammaproteobacteria bacterium]|nr:cyclase family protein [Gammaproteobacteria bacterium]
MNKNKHPFVLLLIILLNFSLFAQATENGPGEPNNWQRWGTKDQLGAANFIRPEHIVRAAGLIKHGKVFSLAIPLDNNGPIYPGRLSPHHIMVVTGADYVAGAPNAIGKMKFADDYIYMPLQGSTQWDALSHAWYGEHLYNGFHESNIKSAPGNGGAGKLGIENVKTAFIGRGVLVDILAYKNNELSPGYTISRKDIESALKKQQVNVGQGDVVLIRTGVVPAYYQLEGPIDRQAFMLGPQTGIGSDVVDWIAEHEVAAVAADNITLEVYPHPDPEKTLSIHGSLLRDLGVYIGEIWWLEDLAEDCARDGVYEFFIAAQPLNIPGAVGSPLNPIAIK